MEKERFLKHLRKKLTSDQREMLETIDIEQQKETIIFRMPVGLVELGGVWDTAEALAKELNVSIKQAGQFATLDELDDLLGDIQWLWNKWVPLGFVTMVAGDPGVGKSAIVQWLVKLVTEGKPFPLEDARQKREPANAIWVDTEASQQLIKVRASSMGMDKKRVYLPVINGDILSQANLGFTKDREMIIDLVVGTQAKLLILDSLGGSHTGGENKVEDIRPILEFLAILARDYNMAVIVIHHLNKGHKDESPEVSLYRLRGSTIIPAMCRSIWAIEKGYEGKNKMRMVKNNLAKAPPTIEVDVVLDPNEEILGFEFCEYQAPPPKKSKKDQCVDWLMKRLNEAGQKGVRPLQLVEEAEGLYTRQMIYGAKETLGDAVMVSGSGHATVWTTMQRDDTSIKKILASSNGKHKSKQEKKDDTRRKKTK